jgi:hypothetical protein
LLLVDRAEAADQAQIPPASPPSRFERICAGERSAGGEPPIPHVADQQQVIYLESFWCDGQEAMRNEIEVAR